MAVRHVFLWRLNPGHDADEIIALLNTLPDRCPGIIGWQIARNQAPPGEGGDSWDGVLISDHESWDALNAYSAHPYHLEVVHKLLPSFAGRAVVDFEPGDG